MARKPYRDLSRACPLYPGSSDINVFSNFKGIVNFYAQTSDGALDLGVTEQQLYRAQVSGPLVYQCRLGSSDRVRTIQAAIQTDALQPVTQQPRVLPRRWMSVYTRPASEQPLPG